MGPHIDGFQNWLLERSYTPGSIRGNLKLVGDLGRWMVNADIVVSELNESVIAKFLETVRVGRTRVPSVRSLRPLLDYLRAHGALAAEARPATPLEQLLAEYRAWLVEDRGLAWPTVIRYENLARLLIRQQGRGGLIGGITAADVVAFLLRESERLSVGSTKGRVAELRSLLRLLHLKGMTPTALAGAVPPVAGWQDTAIPTGLTAAEVERLLDCCDRSGPGGARDFAISHDRGPAGPAVGRGRSP